MGCGVAKKKKKKKKKSMRMRAMKETECKKVVIEAKKGWIKEE